MADTLTNIRKRLNIDQRNLVAARVVSTGSSIAKVRLPDGREITAYMPDNVNTDGLVSVSIAGNTATVNGAATLQQTGGKKIVILD